MSRSRRDFLRSLAWTGAAAAASGTAATAGRPTRPNIVLLFADDLGYADIGLHGAQDLKTPNIDALGLNGMQFEQGYVTYPACGPSRASLMTGRHHHRIGFPTNPDQVIPTRPGNPRGLSQEEITLPELLKRRGYATGMVGKWHLGHSFDDHPIKHGFDEFYGFMGSLYRYFDLGNLKPPKCIMRGTERVHEKEYLTYAFAREANHFIARHRDEPFFLYVAFNAVHTPLMDDEDPGPVDIPLNGVDDPRENRKTYINMVEALDTAVGDIRAKLREAGLEENTLVFFISDNGGARKTGAYRNDPLRDYKGTLFEGGIRVPFLAEWPGTIPAGSRYQPVVSSMDVYATCARLAGASLPGDRVYDSADLTPVLAGRSAKPLHDEPLFWKAQGMKAVRDGDWKLVVTRDGRPHLYDIRNDIGEEVDLATVYPERTRTLMRAFERWEATLPPPDFKRFPAEEYRRWEKRQERASG
ncbi:sulfatase-like hydrolase/transferase [Kiritimatiella glycovorans]|uniref:Arylsulfatase n=1 Tax=Kiritimatiella glycovorans TaxID=1307763 RepID=A0A0G3EH28_9BACT|nr:sulfatase-like hydrolase/transferase [Kiritimatiella glycovorans]AKJ64727.1 Arylsulfatase [Kiritimatiella glycovorans]